MKNALTAIICFWALAAFSQNKGDTKELDVYARDGKTVIAKVITGSSEIRKLFLIKAIQKKDSAGIYATTFFVGNKETGPLLDARIVLRFNKPVISVVPSFATAFNHVNGLSDDHETYLFKAGRLERDAGSAIVVSFVIRSKERIITEISGLEGLN